MGRDRGVEEPAGRGRVASSRYVYINDLAVLINNPIHVTPYTGDLDIGLVNDPTIPDLVTAWSGRFDQLRCETLHPPKDGDMVHLNTAFGEEFLDVAV